MWFKITKTRRWVKDSPFVVATSKLGAGWSWLVSGIGKRLRLRWDTGIIEWLGFEVRCELQRFSIVVWSGFEMWRPLLPCDWFSTLPPKCSRCIRSDRVRSLFSRKNILVLTFPWSDWKPSRLGCHREPIRMACCAYVMCTSSLLPQLVAASSSKGCFVRNSVLTIIPLTEYKSCLELPLLQKPLARFVSILFQFHWSRLY